MLFRTEFTVSQLDVKATSEGAATFTLHRGRTKVEIMAAGESNKSTVIVTADQDVGDNLLDIFEILKRNRLPSAKDFVPAIACAKSGLPWDQQTFMIEESMPEAFRDYRRSLRNKMRDAVEQTVGLIRWRDAQWGPSSAIAKVARSEWSHNGDN